MNNSDDNEDKDDGQDEEGDGQHEKDDGLNEEGDGQLEQSCFGCNNFFPDLLNLPTEFGICLKDEAFDPFIDEMLENENFECCRELIEQKRFNGNCDTCEDFEECEIVGVE